MTQLKIMFECYNLKGTVTYCTETNTYKGTIVQGNVDMLPEYKNVVCEALHRLLINVNDYQACQQLQGQAE